MIHEITPHVYDNAFRICTPKDSDIALYYAGKDMLIWQNEGTIDLPRFEQLNASAKENAEYLFSIDELGFYLLKAQPQVCETYAGSITMQPTQLMRSADQWIGFAGITGAQFSRWEKSRKFCGKCGALMRHSSRERAMVCPECKLREYPKISPAIIVAISDGDDLLMIKSPGSTTNRYHLIAGYVEVGETFEQTVAREAMEEVGVKVKNIRYYKSQPWSFSDTIMVGFTAELDGERTPFSLQEEEIADAKWIRREDIVLGTDSSSIGSEMIRNFKEGK